MTMQKRPRELYSFAAALLFMQQAPQAQLERLSEPAPPPPARVAHFAPTEGWVSYQRFWRTDRNTLVDAIIRVPVLKESAPADAPLQTQVIVEDAAGNVLLDEIWQDSTRTAAIEAGTAHEIATPVRFVLANGSYTMHVKASRGSVRDSTSVALNAYSTKPLVSDLVLTPGLRRIAANERVRLPEVAHGSYALRTAPRAIVDENTPQLWYYIELYPDGGEIGASARLGFEIVRESDGRRFKGTDKTVTLNEGSVADVGMLGISDLRPGRYNLEVTIRAPDRRETRRVPFTVARGRQ